MSSRPAKRDWKQELADKLLEHGSLDAEWEAANAVVVDLERQVAAAKQARQEVVDRIQIWEAKQRDFVMRHLPEFPGDNKSISLPTGDIEIRNHTTWDWLAPEVLLEKLEALSKQDPGMLKYIRVKVERSPDKNLLKQDRRLVEQLGCGVYDTELITWKPAPPPLAQPVRNGNGRKR